MRIFLGTLALLLAVPATASSAVVSGGGALASFESLSDDGCVYTFGEVAVVEVHQDGGALASGLYVVGMQEDFCLGTGNGFAGFTPGDFTVNGLSSAHVAGTVVVDSYSGGPAVTVELDLTWAGEGAVSSDGGRFDDGTSISFTYARYRAASTSGTFTLDGAAMTVTSAMLVGETSGQVSQ